MVTHAAKSGNQTQFILGLSASQHLQADNELVEGLLAMRRQSVSDDGLAAFLLNLVILLLKTFDVADDLTELRGVHCYGLFATLRVDLVFTSGHDIHVVGNLGRGV